MFKKQIFTLKNKIILIIVLIILVTCLLFYYLNKKVIPIINTYAESESKRIVSLIINNSVLKMSLKEDNIEKYLIITKNNNNEIISVDFNTSFLNKKLYDLTNNINDKLYNLKKNKKIDELIYFKNDDLFYYIPIGIITYMPFFSNLGSKLPIKINIIGNIISNAKIDVIDYGINNALIKVYIDVEVNISLIVPFNVKKIKVKNQIPIIVKIIQGNVPSIYGGLYSNTSPLITN